MMQSAFSPHAQIAVAIFCVVILFTLFELIRRHRLQERYSVLWVMVVIGLLAITLIPGTLELLTRITGIRTSSLALLGLLGAMEISLLIRLTSIASTQDEALVRLSPEIALQRLKSEELEEIVENLQRNMQGSNEAPE